MNLSKTAKTMILACVAVYFILLVLGLVLLNLAVYFDIFSGTFIKIEGNLPYILGLTLGGIHSVIKVIMIEKAMIKITGMEEGTHAKNIGQLYYFGRFFITLAVLVIGALPVIPFIGFLGTIVGVFSLRLAAYLTAAIEAKREKKRLEEEGPIEYNKFEEEDIEEIK